MGADLPLSLPPKRKLLLSPNLSKFITTFSWASPLLLFCLSSRRPHPTFSRGHPLPSVLPSLLLPGSPSRPSSISGTILLSPLRQDSLRPESYTRRPYSTPHAVPDGTSRDTLKRTTSLTENDPLRDGPKTGVTPCSRPRIVRSRYVPHSLLSSCFFPPPGPSVHSSLSSSDVRASSYTVKDPMTGPSSTSTTDPNPLRSRDYPTPSGSLPSVSPSSRSPDVRPRRVLFQPKPPSGFPGGRSVTPVLGEGRLGKGGTLQQGIVGDPSTHRVSAEVGEPEEESGPVRGFI